MKKRYLAAGTIGAAVGAAVAWKFLTRAKGVNWEDFAGQVHHPEYSRFVEIDGATIHYQEFGDKHSPALILIHGYTASTYVWHTAAPLLAEKGFRVLAVDLLGFGFSAKPAAFDYSIVSQARVISRFMNRLGVGRATVVGSSYGGAVASTLALDYPERVEKLVLVSSVCNDDVKNHPILKLAAIPAVGELITPFVSDSKLFLKRRMRGTLAPENHHLITKERLEAVRRPLHAADAHRSILRTARNWDACRIEADAPLINHPTLLIWGEKDEVVPMSNGERLHESILNSRLVVFKNCGHVPQEEAPDDFVNVVAEFVKNRKGRAAGEKERNRIES